MTVIISGVRDMVCAQFDLESVAEVHFHVLMACAGRAAIAGKNVEGARGGHHICHAVLQSFRRVFAQFFRSIAGMLAKFAQFR